MMAAVTPRDIYDIVKLQVFLALKGDPMAVREVLDRTVGKAPSVEELAAIEEREMPAVQMPGVLEEEVRLMIESVPNVLETLTGEADLNPAPADAGPPRLIG